VLKISNDGDLTMKSSMEKLKAKQAAAAAKKATETEQAKKANAAGSNEVAVTKEVTGSNEVAVTKEVTGSNEVAVTKVIAAPSPAPVDLSNRISTTVDDIFTKAKADAFDNIVDNQKILDGLKNNVNIKEAITDGAESYALQNNIQGDLMHKIDAFYKAGMPVASKGLFGGTYNLDMDYLKGWHNIDDVKKLDLNDTKDLDTVNNIMNHGGIKIDADTVSKAATYDDLKILENLDSSQRDDLVKAAHRYAQDKGTLSDELHEINNFYKAVTSDTNLAKEVVHSVFSPSVGPWNTHLTVDVTNDDVIQPLINAHWIDFDAV
jgi:hypothetical protein